MVCKPDKALTNYLASESINWEFIPLRSSKFGGLWEAGVKSFKYHLKGNFDYTDSHLNNFGQLQKKKKGF